MAETSADMITALSSKASTTLPAVPLPKEHCVPIVTLR